MNLFIDELLFNDFTDIQEMPEPIISENETLGGSIYVDYTANRRSWKVTWDKMTVTNYNLIRAKYDRQYTQNVLPVIRIPDKGVNRFCHLRISNINPKHDNQYVDDFELIIKELGAIS